MARWMPIFTMVQSFLILILIAKVECIAPLREVRCPVKRLPRECMFFGKRIPAGGTLAFEDPCVLVSCTSMALSVIVSGCPGHRRPEGRIHRGAAPNAWPYCCDRCRRRG
uniref:8.9 kDa family member n=1 Tax=Rhipicephalus zambeziensis TaxID=60191 RepID=A0A224Y3R4_9ACAR